MLRPGALRNRLSRTRSEKRPDEKRAPAFLQWLRMRPCALECQLCAGRIEAAHTPGGDAGTATKASDRFAIPLCSYHHATQHKMGWQSFADMHRIKPNEMAADYWRAWPGRAAWEKKLEASA